MSDAQIAWRPSAAFRKQANLVAFMKALDVPDYETLVRRSNAEPVWFYEQLISYIDYRFYEPYDAVIDESEGLPRVRWCLGGTTNVVLNCLDKWRDGERWHEPAIRWEGEDGAQAHWSLARLDSETCVLASGLRKLGIGPGDVVGMYLPNLPQAAVALLAVAKIGGIVLPLFSGFGPDAVATRLADSGAIAVLTVDGSARRGRTVGAKSVIDEAAPQVPTLKHVVVLRHRAAPMDWVEGRDHWWDELTKTADLQAPTEPMQADAPFLLVYTSGTTGKPKGVIHSHCGFPIKTILDLGICMDLKPEDRIMWMSDMGWLVGPLLVFGALTVGATIVLVEGAPDYPEPGRMWRLVDDHKVSYLGVAPTVARAFMAQDGDALAGRDLSSLRVFVSTGEPWNPDSWLWMFERVGKSRVPLLNYSGGTEVGGILSSTVIHPMKPCSFAGPIPGTGADVVDTEGNSVPPGTVGELVMRRPSIGLTRGLWNDDERYLETYWRVLPGMWVHGDFASIDEDGMWYVHGRSDDTLKIAGKRTGPAEIESLLLATGRLREAAVVGAPDAIKGTAIVCVCVPAAGVQAGESLAEELSGAVVKGLGPPFRPKSVVFAGDLPKTRNMKIMRRVVRAVYLGEDPGDLSSLVNPDSVENLKRLLD